MHQTAVAYDRPTQVGGVDTVPAPRALTETRTEVDELIATSRARTRDAVAALAMDRPALPSPITLRVPVGLIASLRAFGRAHSDRLLDVVALLAAAIEIVLVAATALPPLMLVLALATASLLLVRRRFPFAVALVNAVMLLFGGGQLSAMIALGTVARRRTHIWQIVIATAAMCVARTLHWPPQDTTKYSVAHHYLFAAVVGAIQFGAPVLLGVLLQTRTELRAKVAELAASKADLTALAVNQALAEERSRIAREMHDVVSHQVALIAMQAGALQVCQDADRESTARTIRGLCTKTLNELRSLVGTLRSMGEAPPAHGLTDIRDLARCSGAEVELPSDLPTNVTLPITNAAYRTVQEALTNATKYAPESTKTVSISAERGELVVQIVNDAPHHKTKCDLPSGGHGLLGLRERNAGVGGRTVAEPTDRGGFLVRAVFPLPS